MKKMILLTAALILTLSLGAAALAAGPAATPAATYACRANANCQYADDDGDGVCDNCGTQCNFADADGDGICDNRGNASAGRANGSGCGRGAGARNGGHHGRNCR